MVLAFHLDNTGECHCCHAWVSSNLSEHDLIEDWVGAIEPGSFKTLGIDEDIPRGSSGRRRRIGWLNEDEIPEEWLKERPKIP